MSHTITITGPTAESGAPGDDTAPVVITVPESGSGPQERAATEPQAHQNSPDPSREVVDALKKCFPEKFMTKQQKRKRRFQKIGICLFTTMGFSFGVLLGDMFISMIFIAIHLVAMLIFFPEDVNPCYDDSDDDFITNPAYDHLAQNIYNGRK